MAKLYSLKPLLLAMLAFVLAWLGQSALTGSLKINGWILYGIAAVLFVAAFRRVAVTEFALGHLSDTLQETPRPSRLFWALLVLAVLAMLGGVVLFGTPANAPNAWNLHVASVLLFIAAFIPFDKLRHASLQARTELPTLLMRALPIVAVLALAAFARLWQIDQFPFGTWNDEADNGNYAVQMLQDPNYRPVYIESTNLPAHFIYVIALSFRLFGVSTISMRFVTAAFGVVTVAFAYLLFRRWFGERLGLVAALLFAVLRYDLTFSRIALHGVTTPAFEMIVLYFLDRALERKQWSDFAWTGLALGFGLGFYTPFRLFPLVLAVFLGGLLIAALVKYGARAAIRRYLRGMLPHWLVAALALLIAIAPVAQFALRNRDEFFARTNAISIFERRDEPDLAKALWSNVLKHLEMFNVQGDRNGRHNLPEAPMLDPVMGVLFILGTAYALWRWRDPPNLLMLSVFAIMLQGGILSVDFEAPQSLRAIGVIPALVYFITLPVAAATQAVIHFFRRASPRQASQIADSKLSLGFGIWELGLVLLLALITYLNFDLFFNKQKNDPGVWAAYSTAETIVANEMNRLAANYDFILSARYDNHPTVHFLAGNVTNHQRWTVNDRLPLVHDNTGRGVVLMFDGTLLSAYDDARRFYPNAKFQEHLAPKGYSTDINEVILTPDDLRAVRGVVARYFKGDAVERAPVKEQVLTQIAVDWTKTRPLAEPFIAELRGTLYAQQYGGYRFSMLGAPGAALWIDENPVSDAPLTLARGNHALRMQVPGQSSKVELWWQEPNAPQAQLVPAANLFRPPVTNNGLLGAYYQSPDWTGDPAFMQIDPEIAFYFHVVPLPRPYSVEWKGKLFVPTAGEYRFALDSVDGSQLTLDNRVVVDNPKGQTTIEGITPLAEGWHDIAIRFSDKTSGTQIYLYWTPPGASERELMPSRYLLPPMGLYPNPNSDDR